VICQLNVVHNWPKKMLQKSLDENLQSAQMGLKRNAKWNALVQRHCGQIETQAIENACH
jgi:hypothetical protein